MFFAEGLECNRQERKAKDFGRKRKLEHKVVDAGIGRADVGFLHLASYMAVQKRQVQRMAETTPQNLDRYHHGIPTGMTTKHVRLSPSIFKAILKANHGH